MAIADHEYVKISKLLLLNLKLLLEEDSILHTVFPRFSAPARVSAPPIRLQILISAPVRVSAPPSDKRLLQISLDFDQKDGEPELFLNQLTSKSLGLFFFIEYSVKYL